MPHEETSSAESFEQRLRRLRTRIDELPAEQRSHLCALAETLAEGHRHLHDRKIPHHGT